MAALPAPRGAPRAAARPGHPAHPLSFMPMEPRAVVFYPAGAEVYGQGATATCLHQVDFGAVRVYRLLADGRRQISAFHLPGEVFGFEAGPVHHFSAEAMIGSGIRSFRLSPQMEISRDLLPLALHGLARAQKHILLLGRQTALERVAAFLLDMAERQGGLNQVDIPMPRVDIGDYLGLTIETVSRTFSKLREKKIIRLQGSRSVDILKWETLQSMSA